MHWTPLTGADVDDLVTLATACVGADGGLPLAAEPGFVRGRWAADGVVGRAGRDERGRLVAAATVRPSAGGGATVTALVDPSFRAHGYAAELLDWGLAAAGSRPVTVETESLTAEQERLFSARGLRQVFAEDVMRIDLTAVVPAAVWPVGTTLREWTAESAPRFFQVYEAAFRERPGFPGYAAATWISDVGDDDDFRPAWSVLAEVPGLGDAGFVTALVGWIDQVGVAPQARGRGLGAALVRECLTRMKAAGAVEAWLNVNVDNPARSLYLRLGFTDEGRRARFQP